MISDCQEELTELIAGYGWREFIDALWNIVSNDFSPHESNKIMLKLDSFLYENTDEEGNII
jgi:hypothetical protein